MRKLDFSALVSHVCRSTAGRGKGVDCPALPGTLQTTQSDGQSSTMTSFCLTLCGISLLALRAIPPVRAVETGLSPHIQPLSYDLTLKVPVLEHFRGFTGSVVIHFNLTATTSTITLHSKNLYSLRNVSVISSLDGFEPTLNSTRIQKDTVEFIFAEKLPPGEFLLTIGEYSGRLSNASAGVIQRNLTLFTTHLQPNFARELLPCVDHPSTKAAFRLTIIHPINTVAKSNTIAIDVHVVDTQWQKTIFAPTPLLPTYLIAFSIMPEAYKQITRQTTFGVTIRVHATLSPVAVRVLDIATASFELLASMMEIPLPLNKVDFIIVPNYDGGMENWGHVLLSENLAITGDDAHLTYVIAHELAHHWIGNLATIDSWRWICLQEDLTDYISFKVAATVLDHDTRWERFMLSKYVAIQLTEDFFAPEHSLLMPDEVTTSLISSHCYLKGVVLLESLETVVGEEFMMSSIRNLVSTYSSFNMSHFLWFFKDIPVDKDISLAQVYEYWYVTGGFPAISVLNSPLSLELRQLSSSPWPLRITSTPTLLPFLFAQSQILAPVNSQVIINLNFTSFLRVNYDPVTWINVFSQIDEHPEDFSAVGRAQLVNDFCYFYAHEQVDRGDEIKEIVTDVVYRNSEYFELCDWHLFWCHSTMPATLTQLLKRLALGVTRLFDNDAAFGCRTGQAARNINAICNSVFRTRCV